MVLGAHWLSDEEVELVPMVNEMDWLNSAGMLTHFWAESPAPQASDSPTDAAADAPSHVASDSAATPGPSDDAEAAGSSMSGSADSRNGDTHELQQGLSKPVRRSHGYKVAQALYGEILQTWGR